MLLREEISRVLRTTRLLRLRPKPTNTLPITIRVEAIEFLETSREFRLLLVEEISLPTTNPANTPPLEFLDRESPIPIEFLTL